jgi:hypothetical protein
LAGRRKKADMAGVSYRLTPETDERVLAHYTQAKIAAETHEVYRQLLTPAG